MRLIRRFLALLILTALLAGCGGLPAELGGGPVTLRFVYLAGAADYESLAGEFTRLHPTIRIELDPLAPEGDWGRAFSAKMAEADAVRVPGLTFSDEMAAAFMPLDTQMAIDQTFPLADLFPGSLESLKRDGKTLGVPAGLNPYVMFYQPDKLAAAGVPIPQPNWTLRDFVTAAAQVTDAGESLRGTEQFTYGFCTHPQAPDPVIFTYLFGGGLFDSFTQVSQPTLARPENAAALTWYTALKTDLGIVPTDSDIRTVGTLIWRGQCAFWLDLLDGSSWGGGAPPDGGGGSSQGGTRNRAAALPLPVQTEPFTIASVDSYAVLAASPHTEAAWTWISFLVAQPGAAGRLVPPYRSSVLARGGLSLNPRLAAVAAHLPEKTIILSADVYQNKKFGAAFNLFGEVARQVYAGQSAAQPALDIAQDIAQNAD